MDIYHIFPDFTGAAAAQMALDELMLRHCVSKQAGRLRFYQWDRPALTFGYSQLWDALPYEHPAADTERIRRITGGGIVEHGDDLTWSLTIPAGSSRYRVPATQLYQQVHSCWEAAFKQTGQDAVLKACSDCTASPASAASVVNCFTHASPFDVMDRQSGKKLAGAAMKRHRLGILIQGSVRISPAISIRQSLRAAFLSELSCAWNLDWLIEDCWPATIVDALPPMQKLYASSSWNRKR